MSMPFFCYNKDDYCDHSEDCDGCNVWVKGKGGKEVLSNADRIRSMNDTELAEFLMRDDICDARMSPTCDKDGCLACVTDWLHQSVKEDAPCTPT
jgi:hypothetical protein